jgi:hypothetical protein
VGSPVVLEPRHMMKLREPKERSEPLGSNMLLNYNGEGKLDLVGEGT